MREPRAAGWTAAGLAALVIADLVLVWLAMDSTRSAAAGAGTPEVLPTVAAQPVAPASTPGATPTTTPPATEPTVGVPPLTAVLAAVDGTFAYRAATGTCPATPAVLEASRDGGVSWTPSPPADASAIREIVTDGPDVVSVVASTSESCSPVLLRSFVQGDAWQVTEELPLRWSLVDGSVVAPGGAGTSPCADPVQLAQRDQSSAAVLCGDGTLAVTSDTAVSWARTGPVGGAASVAVAEEGYRLAVTRREGCGGVQVVPVSSALEIGNPGGCLPSDAPDGATVLATGGDGTVWVWSGGVVARSFDGGTTW